MFRKLRFTWNRLLNAMDRLATAFERFADELEAEEPATEQNGRPRTEFAKPARVK